MAPHEDEDELHELDATHYFKEKVHLNVNELKTLAITLHKFGYEPDDRIERRDLVQIYRTVESAMENEIASLAHHGHYSSAKAMRLTLTSLRAEFDELLVHGEKVTRHDQLIIFEKAKILKNDQNQI